MRRHVNFPVRFADVDRNGFGAAKSRLETHRSGRERGAIGLSLVADGEHRAVLQAVDDASILERDVEGLDHTEERGVCGDVVYPPGGHARFVDVRSGQVEAHHLPRLREGPVELVLQLGAVVRAVEYRPVPRVVHQRPVHHDPIPQSLVMAKHANPRAVVLVVCANRPPPVLVRRVRRGAQVQAQDLCAAPVRVNGDVRFVVPGHVPRHRTGGVPRVPVAASFEIIIPGEVEAYRRLVDPRLVPAHVRQVTRGDVRDVVPIPREVQLRSPRDDDGSADGVRRARFVILQRRGGVKRGTADEKRILGPLAPHLLLPRVLRLVDGPSLRDAGSELRHGQVGILAQLGHDLDGG
mmetsp:Transcript_4262/g.17570  ORF Transcript_4262/g.17570 Transcript_4262/m.17570 type:complete len:351 (-) Transcript_4262:1585-2637(-)